MDENTPNTPALGQESQPSESATPPEGKPGEGKLLSQEEVDRIVQERLKREREKTRKEFEAEKAEVERRAKLEEGERLKLEKAEAEKRAAEAEARVLRAERRAELAGRVSHPERVLLLMGDQADGYFPGGKADLEAIYRDFPEYQPGDPKAPGGGIRPQTGKSLPSSLDEIAKLPPGQMNAAWEALLKKK
jgi:hypothetical protein